MAIDMEPQIDPDASAVEVAAGGGSILDRIKKRRNEREEEVWLDIPSWGGELQARYQVLDRREIEKMVRRTLARQRSGEVGGGGDSTADLDFLIKACTGVKAVDFETDQEEVIAGGYEMGLVEMLDPQDKDGNPVTVTDQRQLVAYLTKWNGIALATHAQKVARWMQDTSRSVEDPQ